VRALKLVLNNNHDQVHKQKGDCLWLRPSVLPQFVVDWQLERRQWSVSRGRFVLATAWASTAKACVLSSLIGASTDQFK
jgi:hypothetical protein